jgi:hypothetical protein
METELLGRSGQSRVTYPESNLGFKTERIDEHCKEETNTTFTYFVHL